MKALTYVVEPTKQNKGSVTVMERDILVNGIKIHVKSIFNGRMSLEEALKNIIIRRSFENKADALSA